MAYFQPDPQPSSSPSAAVTGQKRKEPSGAAAPDDALQAGDDSSSKKTKMESSFTLADFPVHSANPFQAAFCGSDIALTVEGRKLHTHRSYLSLNSPYFRVLLGSPDFAEANAQDIELKDSEFVEVKYGAMVKFLLHLYPVHSFQPITDDQTLMDLFPLAEYFQCQHVRTKCESYVRQQLDSVGNQLSAESALIYLYLCVKCVAVQFIEGLLDTVSRNKSTEIQDTEQFKWLTSEMQKEVLQRRFKYAEARVDELKETGKRLFTYSSENIETCGDCTACCKRVCCAYLVCKECHAAFKKKLEDK